MTKAAIGTPVDLEKRKRKMMEKKPESDFSKLPPEADELCVWRRCLHRGYNKGNFTPGRGYTSYFAIPEYVCMTRMQHGCPNRSLPDVERMLHDLNKEIEESVASVKSKKLMRKIYHIVRLLVMMVPLPVSPKENPE